MEQKIVRPTQTVVESPLKGFYRKPKFQMTLVSGGLWYPNGSLKLNPNNTVDVYAMTAADDIKFRAGEATLSGNNTYSLIKNCIPNIIDPVNMPSLDLDSLLLAIRRASYGDTMEITCDVPNTSWVRKVTINISEILANLPDVTAWDTILNVINETQELFVFRIKPSPLHVVFEASKGIIKTRQKLNTLVGKNDGSDEDFEKFDSSVQYLGELTVNIIASSIESITFPDGESENNPTVILDLLNSMDVEYFNAIKAHVEAQREKFALKTNTITSTPAEIAAGAPEQWNGAIMFAGADFFAKNNA